VSKEKLNEFKESVKDFFLNPERHTDGSRMKGFNKSNVIAVLIAGFVGWLLITSFFGAKLKKMLGKVPVLGSLLTKRRVKVKRRPAQIRRRATRRK
jgi:hypothetical protein